MYQNVNARAERLFLLIKPTVLWRSRTLHKFIASTSEVDLCFTLTSEATSKTSYLGLFTAYSVMKFDKSRRRPIDLFTDVTQNNNFLYFSYKQKNNHHRSIYHAKFSKYERFHQNLSQTSGNMRRQTC